MSLLADDSHEGKSHLARGGVVLVPLHVLLVVPV